MTPVMSGGLGDRTSKEGARRRETSKPAPTAQPMTLLLYECIEHRTGNTGCVYSAARRVAYI
jgi:hypothetical protein